MCWLILHTNVKLWFLNEFNKTLSWNVTAFEKSPFIIALYDNYFETCILNRCSECSFINWCLFCLQFFRMTRLEFFQILYWNAYSQCKWSWLVQWISFWSDDRLFELSTPSKRLVYHVPKDLNESFWCALFKITKPWNRCLAKNYCVISTCCIYDF